MPTLFSFAGLAVFLNRDTDGDTVPPSLAIANPMHFTSDQGVRLNLSLRCKWPSLEKGSLSKGWCVG